ncbi:MAG: tetratricopeptide repeat protein [Acidobacteriota bacterium]
MTATKKKKIKKSVVQKRVKSAKKTKAPVRPKLSEQYLKALNDFDRAVHDLNRGAFTEAKTRLLEIVEKNPKELALKEKAQIYIKICDKKLEQHSPRMKELNDFYNMGVLKMNDENYDEAIKYYEKALSFDPRSEKVLYALSAANALKGNKEESISHLKTAIRIQPQNRIRAKMDPDFDSLRTDSEFNELLEPREEEMP